MLSDRAGLSAVPAVPRHGPDARMPLLDAVKGLACAVIVGHHLARYGPLAAGASVLAPGFMGWLARDGRLAVQVFLVLSGFLAASRLAPNGRLRIDRPWVRVMQRYGRLVMPYLVALSFSVLVAAWVRPWLDEDMVPAAPLFSQLLAHGLLLQDLLGFDALSTGVWYVAIDFQLFTLALAAIVLSEMIQRRWSVRPERSRFVGVAIVLLLVVASLAGFNRYAELDATALYFFGSYGLGMLVFWIGRASRRGTWGIAVLLLALLGVAMLALDWRSRIAIALVTALALAVAQRREGQGSGGWFTPDDPFVRLGRISYSLFLIHFPVLLLVNGVASRFAPMAPWADAAALLGTFALSIAAAWLLYRWVESRPATWPMVMALFAGLLACGALVG